MPPLSEQLLQQQQHQQFSAEKMARVASEDAREARLLFEGMGRAHLEHAVSSQLEIHHEIYNRHRDGHVPPPARTPGMGQRGGATSGVVRQLWGTEPGLAAPAEGGACDAAYATRPPQGLSRLTPTPWPRPMRARGLAGGSAYYSPEKTANTANTVVKRYPGSNKL